VGVVAGAGAIAALGFLGGVAVQKSRGSETPPAGRLGGGFAGATGVRAGAGGPGAAGGSAGAGQQQAGATIGDVSSVDGATLYVDAGGNTLRIRLAKGGKVTRTAVFGVSAIHPGDTVVVQGETASSGTVVASSIRATASNADAGFGGAARGATGAPDGGG
jgi:hypothetical protein